MSDINILYETYNQYIKNAEAYESNGAFEQAKHYYKLAAEVMIKMAQEAKGELQQARINKVKQLLEHATKMGNKVSVENINKSNQENLSASGEKSEDDWETAQIPNIHFSDIAGLDKVKETIRLKLIYPRTYKDYYNTYNKNISGGVFLYGPPGTGKTMIAKAIACEVGAKFYYVKGSDILNQYVGGSEANIKKLFSSARKQELAIIFIDEADGLLRKRGDDPHNDKRVNEFLQEMDGFSGRANNIMMLAATNFPWNLDPAALRPGRFSEKIFVPLPDFQARLFMLKKHFKNIPGVECLDFAKYANLTKGYSGADIEALCEKAKNYPILDAISSQYCRNITDIDVVKALKDTRPSVSKELLEQYKAYDSDAYIEVDAEDTNAFTIEKDVQSNDNSVNDNTQNETKETSVSSDNAPEELYLNDEIAGINDFKFDWDSLPNITFDDVAGLEDVKQVVNMKVLLPLKNPEMFDGYVKNNGGGLLLYGPPGTGKTMIAAAIANEIGAKFCSVKPSDLLHQGAGNSEKAVRALFAQARQEKCAVIYFDEMDSIAPKDTRSQYAKQLRSEFLAQLQGIDAYKKGNGNILFLIAATNKPYDIDSAFIRPGRFGTRVYVGLPDYDARKYIIELRLRKIRDKGIVHIADDINADLLTEKTNGFNCSDITNFLDNAEESSILRGFATNEKSLCMADFEEALTKVSSSVQKDDLVKLREWKDKNTI